MSVPRSARQYSFHDGSNVSIPKSCKRCTTRHSPGAAVSDRRATHRRQQTEGCRHGRRRERLGSRMMCWRVVGSCGGGVVVASSPPPRTGRSQQGTPASVWSSCSSRVDQCDAIENGYSTRLEVDVCDAPRPDRHAVLLQRGEERRVQRAAATATPPAVCDWRHRERRRDTR